MIRSALFAALILTACRLEQAPSCASFIKCQAAYDAEFHLSTDVTPFLPDGDCWGHPETAADCAQICARQQAALINAAADAGKELANCATK